MRKLAALFALCIALGLLNAIVVQSPGGEQLQINLDQLKREKLISFETRRDKDGAILSETWEGISLMSWLKANLKGDWQNLKLQSKDDYIVNLSRLELSDSNLFLAMKLNGAWLSEYDIRVIHTPSRENAWVRNLAFIKLEDFLPYPKPQQIFLMQDWLKERQTIFRNNSITFTELLPAAFSLESAEVILVDSSRRRYRMNYPRDLGKAKLLMGNRGELSLDLGKSILPGQSEEFKMGDLVYLQAGPIALLADNWLPNIESLADILAWNWDKESIAVAKAKYKSIHIKKQPVKVNKGNWLELR